MTGSLGADGTVFAQTLDEGGGGLNQAAPKFYPSLDRWRGDVERADRAGTNLSPPGRDLWTATVFHMMGIAPQASYWREMGWGEPAVGPNGVVHYAYSAHGAGGDPGDIFYVRSTDNGLTWSAPLKLNTDATTRAQWSPSLSVNAMGQVFVSWYDERNTSTDALERFGRASTDNGATWGSDMALSDVIFPKPLQPDPGPTNESGPVQPHRLQQRRQWRSPITPGPMGASRSTAARSRTSSSTKSFPCYGDHACRPQ